MKRWLTVFSVGLLVLLSGCSYLNNTYDTLDYVNDAKDYLDSVVTFADETSVLLQQAVDDPQAANDLKTTLQQMKDDLESFNTLDVPETVAAFHHELMEQNNLLSNQIDIYLNHIKDDRLDPTLRENGELLQPIQEITHIIEQLNRLGTQVKETLNASHGA
ncbi:hypothetical protein J1P26_03175 [Neobacillus sp. MM2021_6]|uniref:DUF6376 family protein n=1 Tax=Bacillaceae TaxID=186817 RepID=UPI00140E876B|nr:MULTISPECIES: DUF6376 family protein [Bacillaceae]MBO0958722.1 hypothetical protein [Neobacillus sp. MM2021_6]NHC18183.1 hypothetical protein [Bacillus sp. MM2020_4]